MMRFTRPDRVCDRLPNVITNAPVPGTKPKGLIMDITSKKLFSRANCSSVPQLQRAAKGDVGQGFGAGPDGVREFEESPAATAPREEFLMGAVFAQFAVVQDNDAVGALDG